MNDWLTYSNQGATRNLPLSPRMVAGLGAFLPDMGITANVYSGGQPPIGSGLPRVGSTRHDDGGAGDMYLTHHELGLLDLSNPAHIPVWQEVVRRARANGFTGIGAGNGSDYMGPHGIHIGYGPEAVWGDNGSSANAPQWLRDAFYGATPGSGPYFDPSQPPSVFNQPPQFQQANAFAGAPQGDPVLNALAMTQQFQPQVNSLNAADFMTSRGVGQLLPIGVS